MSQERPKTSEAIEPKATAAEEKEQALTPIEQEYLRRTKVTNALLDELVDLAIDAEIMRSKISAEDKIDLLLGRGEVDSAQKKPVTATSLQRENVEDLQRKQREKLADEIQKKVIAEYGSTWVKRWRAGAPGKIAALKWFFTGGIAGRRETNWDVSLKALVEHRLRITHGKYAGLSSDVSENIDPRMLNAVDLVNDELRSKLTDEKAQSGGLADEFKKSLTATQKEQLREEAEQQLIRTRQAISKKTDQELVDNPDLRIKEDRLLELVPGLKAKYGHSRAGGLGTSEAGGRELERLTRDGEFVKLQTTMRSIRGYFHDKDPAGILTELQQRGVMETGGYLPCDVMIIATFGPDELRKDYENSYGRVAGMLRTDADKVHILLSRVLRVANTLANKLNAVLGEVGYPVNESKLKLLEKNIPGTGRGGDDKKKLKIRMLAGIGGITGGVKELIASGSKGDLLHNDIASLDEAAESIDLLVIKSAATRSENVTASESAPALQTISEAEPATPERTLEWLQGSEHLGSLEEFLADAKWAKAIKDYTGLDIAGNPKHLQQFLRLFILQDITSIEGISIQLPDGEMVPIDQVRQAGEELRPSDCPLGSVLTWMIVRKKNPKAPIPPVVVEYFQRVKENVIESDPAYSPDYLFEMAETGMRYSVQAIKALQRRKIKFPPSVEAVDALIEEISQTNPRFSGAWFRQYVGMSMEDQLLPREVTDREGNTTQETYRQGYMLPHPQTNFVGIPLLVRDGISQLQEQLAILEAFNESEEGTGGSRSLLSA